MCTSRGNGGGGGGGITKSSLNTDVKTQRTMLMPELIGEGTEKEIINAQKQQRQLAENLYYYATERDSDGRKISPELNDKLTKGTAADIKKHMNDRADRLTFGNDDLKPQKIEQVQSEQRDLAERQNRLVKVMNSSNFKSIKWLNNPTITVKNIGKVNFKSQLERIGEAYIDGKSSDYFKKQGLEDLTGKFFN